MDDTGDLFNTGKNQLRYSDLLSKVQNFLSERYSSLLSEKNKARKKEMEQSYIRQYIREHEYSVPGCTTKELVAALYNDMAEYSFLTPYLNGENTDWEEININRWDDVKITYCNGSVERSKEQFLSPSHATDVMKRLLQQSNITFDEAKPCVRGHLNNKIRITINGPGVIDDDVGIQASIRYINPKKLGRDDFIRNGMATEEMLDFLSVVYRYGISICLAGPTGSGKTTVMSWILSTVPDYKRVYTIENTTREFDLTKRNENNVVLNNVIHTVTRDSDDPKQCVTEQMLLEQGLTFDPDYICMAEMKGAEAFQTQEAARTGHAVITTVHAKSCSEIYDRILDLCSLNGNLSGEMLKVSIAKAFPITFITRKMEDNVRRIVEICECVPYEDGSHSLNTLFRFHTIQNYVKNGKTVVNGRFEKISVISEKLQQELRDNGIPEDLLKRLIGDGQK
jgi:pilus assembly protein CpaF